MSKSRTAIPGFGTIIAFAMAIILSATSIARAASAYLVLDAKSGRILAASNGDAHHYPASLTKMMTLYLAFEALHRGRLTWHTRIPFSKHAASRPPTKLSVRPGAWITLREAVLAMIVRSANDAAVALAEKLGRTEARFARMMTAKAHALGMSRTLFTNASGLPDRRQVTTARDMSTLAVALINRFPHEYTLFSVPSFRFRGHLIRGHNHLMYRYKGMDGIKTGYTRASGFNLVSAVRAGYRRVIGVVLGGRTAKSRDAKMAALLDRYLPKASSRKTTTLIASVGPGLAPRKRIPRPAVHEKQQPDHIEPAAKVASSQWQIQLTATSSRSAAIALLRRARALFDDTLAGLPSHTEPVACESDTLYRARFAGFASRQLATEACETLAAHDLDCVAIPPHR
jgi:D-alanyl-D-alanine carboxypeptidase (penicillin-binding protein 5/6)